MENDRENNPTFDNILDKYKSKPEDNMFKATKLKGPFKENQPTVGMPGLFNCPWCDSEMEEIGDTVVAVCKRNAKHKVLWLPWGG